jgi:hypothetical protein
MVRCLAALTLAPQTIAVLTLTCLSPTLQAQMTGPPPEPLLDAAHCLATAKTDWLGLTNDASEVELGYASGPGSWQGGDPFYLVDYSSPVHSQGSVFVFVVRGKAPHRALRLEYKVQFRQSDDGSQQLELIDPQFGGISTQDRVLSAVREVGFHTYAIPVTGLLLPSNKFACESEEGIE